MSDIFISYARSTETTAHQVAERLRALGYHVWRDDQLPAHRAYTDVIEERLRAAKAVVVIWSAEALKSQWVRAEADLARQIGTLVQLSIDGSAPPLPFNQIQCADLKGWAGNDTMPGWQKVVASVAELMRDVTPDAGATQSSDEPVTAKPLALPDKPSIAVLPFANLTGDPDQEFFVDGLMEEIVTSLSRIRTIFVISSGSSRSLKGQDITPVEAANRLGVHYILEGSVRRAANRVRIAVKLIDGVGGAQIWAQRFEDKLDDIFELEDRVALSVAGIIEFSVQTAETERSIRRPTEDLRSYELYLRALLKFRTYRKEDMFEALDLTSRAIALDQNYALALSLAAGCHAIIMQFHWSDNAPYHGQQMMELIARSLQTGSDDPQVLASAAMAYWTAGNFAPAAQLANRATQLNPGSSWPWLARGQISVALGEIELADECLERSMRLDPLSPNRSLQLGALAAVRFAQHRFAEAIEINGERHMLASTPISWGLMIAAYGHLGQIPVAREALGQFRAITSMSFADIAAMYYQKAEHRQLFLDGVAAVEGHDAQKLTSGEPGGTLVDER